MTSVRTFQVPDISCDHCKAAIEGSVGKVTGVASVDVDVDTKIVSVTGGTDADVIAAIDDAGYDVA